MLTCAATEWLRKFRTAGIVHFVCNDWQLSGLLIINELQGFFKKNAKKFGHIKKK